MDLHYVEWSQKYSMLCIHDNLCNQFSVGGYPGGFRPMMSNFGHASLCTSTVISEGSIPGRQIAECKDMYSVRTFTGSGLSNFNRSDFNWSRRNVWKCMPENGNSTIEGRMLGSKECISILANPL